ncbi:MAG: phosphatase PAP2 family protein [Eggerthellaceae bacterium]
MGITAIDFAILQFIQAHALSPFLNVVMPAVSAVAFPALAALAVVLVIRPATRREGLALLVALALVFVVCTLTLKPLVGRVRPCVVDTTVPLLVSVPHGYSFPSGHTSAVFAAFGALFFANRNGRLVVPTLVFAIIVAFSRLYLYVHFPTDVLAGVCIGLALGWLAAKIVDALAKRHHLLPS